MEKNQGQFRKEKIKKSSNPKSATLMASKYSLKERTLYD
jgi:hypothetical protein